MEAYILQACTTCPAAPLALYLVLAKRMCQPNFFMTTRTKTHAYTQTFSVERVSSHFSQGETCFSAFPSLILLPYLDKNFFKIVFRDTVDTTLDLAARGLHGLLAGREGRQEDPFFLARGSL